MNLKNFKYFNLLAEYLFKQEVEKPIAKARAPIYFEKQEYLSLPDQSIDRELSLENLKTIIEEIPKTTSPKFFNQLFGGRQDDATIGELLSVLMNNSMYTYKVSGVLSIIEKNIIDKIISLINFGQNAGGTFAPGGSMTNLMGMIMARDNACPSAKQEGVFQKLITYTSDASHYSIPKNASIIGLGKENVRLVNTLDNGKMSVAALETEIKKDLESSHKPMIINATAGTTVLGSFDSIEEISKIAKKYNIWLHVDGAYCGAVFFSEKYKKLIKGVEKADSFSFNAHKMLGTPLSTSLIFVKNKEHLYHSFDISAEYLYQTQDDDYNLGKISLQCGRRNDSLKLFTLWQSLGKNGLEKIINHLFDMAKIAKSYIENNKDYTSYSYENSLSICFNYKNIDPVLLCTKLYEEGELVVGYGEFKNQKFVRLVIVNSNNGEKEILDFFKSIENFAKKLELSQTS